MNKWQKYVSAATICISLAAPLIRTEAKPLSDSSSTIDSLVSGPYPFCETVWQAYRDAAFPKDGSWPINQEDLCSAALEEAEKLPDSDPRLAESIWSLALLIHFDLSQKENLFKRYLKLSTVSVDRKALALDSLADVLAQEGKYSEAKDCYNRLLAFYDHKPQQFHSQNLKTRKQKESFLLDLCDIDTTANTLVRLADCYLAEDKYARAIALNENAKDLYEIYEKGMQKLGSNFTEQYSDIVLPKSISDQHRIDNLSSLATSYLLGWRYADAEKTYRNAIIIFKELHTIPEKIPSLQSAYEEDLGGLFRELSVSLILQGKYAEAKETLSTAMAKCHRFSVLAAELSEIRGVVYVFEENKQKADLDFHRASEIFYGQCLHSKQIADAVARISVTCKSGRISDEEYKELDEPNLSYDDNERIMQSHIKKRTESIKNKAAIIESSLIETSNQIVHKNLRSVITENIEFPRSLALLVEHGKAEDWSKLKASNDIPGG